MNRETTARSLDRVRQTYEELGNRDPFWAVLTDDTKRGNKWDSHEFFETGRSEREYMRPLWKQVRGRTPVQIHYVPQKKVEGIITASKGTLLHTREMRSGRGRIRAMWYFATRVGCCETRERRGQAYKKDE